MRYCTQDTGGETISQSIIIPLWPISANGPIPLFIFCGKQNLVKIRFIVYMSVYHMQFFSEAVIPTHMKFGGKVGIINREEREGGGSGHLN